MAVSAVLISYCWCCLPLGVNSNYEDLGDLGPGRGGGPFPGTIIHQTRYRRDLGHEVSHDPTLCLKDRPFVWCLPSDYNKEKHPFTCKKQNNKIFFLNLYFFSSDFHLMNETLPLKYNFKFVIDEISNINDKAQVMTEA